MWDIIFYLAIAGIAYYAYGYMQRVWLQKKLDQFTAEKCPKDVVIMHGTERMPGVPSPSPFVLKLETFLRMAKIPYEYDGTLRNTFGPKGKTPWISMNGEHVADSQLCIEYLTKKFKVNLDSNYTEKEKASAKLVRYMFEEHMFWEFVLWLWVWGGPGIEAVIKLGAPRFLVKYLSWNYTRLSWSQGMGRHSRDDVERWTYQDLETISVILDNNKFILGDEPCVEDAAVFGFLAQLIWGCMTTSTYSQVVRFKYPNIQAYCERMRARYFPDWDQICAKPKSKTS